MKICLFDTIGNVGIVIGWKRLITDNYYLFEIDREGELRIGEKTYQFNDGQARVPQYHLVFGEQRNINFVDKQGKTYSCGTISRTGTRLININNDLESCLIACLEKLNEQEKEIKKLKNNIWKIENEYGVSLN